VKLIKITNIFKKITHDTRGAVALEYALICALVFLVFLSAVQATGNNTTSMINHVNTSITSAR
jgi:Flp pilus assembly pilin Flp